MGSKTRDVIVKSSRTDHQLWLRLACQRLTAAPTESFVVELETHSHQVEYFGVFKLLFQELRV